MGMSCNDFKELCVGQVIESTGLVGRRTAKSLCNAMFAIQLFSVGSD